MFKVKGKILLELDVPTISGLIYPKEVALSIIKKVKEQKIYGIVSKNEYLGDIYEKEIKGKETFCWIDKPRVIVDETEEPSQLLLICDVIFDESKMDEKLLNLIKLGKWRISVAGNGISDTETHIVENYEMMFFIIENVEELYYNNKD